MLRAKIGLFSACVLAIACAAPSNAPKLSDKVLGHCDYTGPNSKLPECKDYLGEWKVADAEKECAGAKGTFASGTLCTPKESDTLGVCLLGAKPEQNRIYIVSTNTGKCGGSRTGCEFFGGGYWQPSSVCGGVSTELVVLENASAPPKKVCITPSMAEPAGHSANGQVCAYEGIHGATEEGRSYRKDVSCLPARSGRPYYPKDMDARYDKPDVRRSDAAYLAEEAWVKSQVNAASCVCCHSSDAPNGPSIFDVDRTGSFANQFTDRGVAHGSGDVNSIPLGAWPASENNGFQKSDLEHPDDSIFLSTDPPRMKKFWIAEMKYRGLTAADFVGKDDGFGPLSEQFYFKPAACAPNESIAADGTITWGNGRARYVYVMEATAKAPTVAPNLVLPKGTIWRLDVPPNGTPLVSGSVKYGVVPEGLKQSFPVTGAPAALEKGKQYFLYASADQLLPITRCLMTAP
jgi:hypothetical protein